MNAPIRIAAGKRKRECIGGWLISCVAKELISNFVILALIGKDKDNYPGDPQTQQSAKFPIVWHGALAHLTPHPSQTRENPPFPQIGTPRAKHGTVHSNTERHDHENFFDAARRPDPFDHDGVCHRQRAG
jgi:hypothetical protein